MSRAAQSAPPPVPRLQAGIDAGVLLLLLGLGVLGFGPTFGGDARYLVAGFAGIILGLGIAWAGRLLRWGLWMMIGVFLGTYLVLGHALAAPQEAFLGFLPTLRSLRILIVGVVFSWKDILTVADPVGTASGMLVVPFLAAMLCAVVAGTLAWRLRTPYWPMLPVLVLFATGIAFGTNRASLPEIRGILLVVAAMAWLAYRRDIARTDARTRVAINPAVTDPATAASGRNRRLALGAGVLAAATVLTLALSPVVAAGQDRRVLRDVVEPPVDLFAYPSPLTSFRKYVKDNEDTVLFTVDGLPEGERVRLAALDAYDGVVYNVNPQAAGNFARVGDAQQLGDIDPDDLDGGTSAQLTFDIKDYSGVWLPAGGELEGVRLGGPRASELGRSLYYNDEARTALSTVGVQSGDTYEVNALFPETFSEEQLAQYGFADLTLPRVQNDPPVIAAKAGEYIGAVSEPIERARRLEQVLSAQGFFSNGKEDEAKSLPGHGAARMLNLLDADQMVGDDEQYAVAMALMARKVNIPARVVMGFYPDWDEVGNAQGPLEITGGDVHAWVEVAFDGVGWVAFNPTPPEDNEPVPPQQQPKSSPKPQVLQPPPPPQEPAELPPDSAPEPQDAEEREKDLLDELAPYLAIIGVVLIPVVVLVVPLVVVALLKRKRRKRREHQGLPADRVGGGWSELVSLATDLGAETNPRATRRESARELGAAFPQSSESTTKLASRADAGIFAAGDPSEDEVQDYWRDVRTSLDGMRGSVGFWKRQRARFSPRSLLRDAEARRGTGRRDAGARRGGRRSGRGRGQDGTGGGRP
ncbi:transglutaminase family protein [Arthrobacter agilis]|uniref:transglutaminase family protein n=1 Tax=Arthrobacter agilis TaxID=37921 RepID=UPI00277DF479|nr:transglutaminase domain-containing protein [Arthrobacter agilis]MDQ0734113.1 putative membrane protein [Arthrobacter agilis]